MVNIILVCAAGMSTSLMVNKMKKAAEEQGKEVHIEAMSAGAFEKYENPVDVLLVGPQISYLYSKIQQKCEARGIKSSLIDMKDYGMMDGKTVLEKAYKMLEG
jgi:PTS system cellobiose-specific IIB component